MAFDDVVVVGAEEEAPEAPAEEVADEAEAVADAEEAEDAV